MLTARLYTWSRAHTLLIDSVVAGLLFLTTGLLAAAATGWPGLLVAVLTIAPLAVRRRWPVLVMAWVVAVSLLQLVLSASPSPVNVVQPLVLYTVAAHVDSFRVRLAALGFGLLGAVLAAMRWFTNASGAADIVVSAIGLSIFMTLVWVLGNLVRGRESMVTELRAANDALEREREQRDLLAAQRARVAIARDVHDIVAHSLSVVVVQADGAGYAAEHAERWQRADAAQALTAIGLTAREALAETRRVVAVLREDEGLPHEAAPGRPDPRGLADIPRLVASVRAAGLTVQDGSLPGGGDVAPETGLTAYRVVQEGLTNVLKHAGPTAQAQVCVERLPGLLRVTVSDTGGPAPPLVGDGDRMPGSGLVGMRERVAAAGGQLVAGPRAGGGFTVTATLPVGPEGGR